MITVLTRLAGPCAASILLLIVAGAVIDTTHERHVPPVTVLVRTVDIGALLAYGGCGVVLGLLLCTLVDVKHWMWIVLASVFTILLMVAGGFRGRCRALDAVLSGHLRRCSAAAAGSAPRERRDA